MESLTGFDMRFRRKFMFLVCFSVLFSFFAIWKLHEIHIDLKDIQCNKIVEQNRDLLETSHKELTLVERLYKENINKSLPTIYAITPTYYRYVQKAELTRLSQTLRLVSNLHWIIVEDSEVKTDLVTNLLNESHLVFTHLAAKTPPFEKLKAKDPRWKRHRGIEQRNAGLNWLRENLVLKGDKGIVYFMDDDNTYSVKLFEEMRKIKKVGIWPVGLVGGFNAEAPIVDRLTGKVTGYQSGWKPNRTFAIDMAGFGISLDLILSNPNAEFSYKMAKGCQESEFLSFFITKEDLEPLADNCTKVYVWHTRTETPKIAANIPGLEV
ncbi:galactosylgalactosylxylosylprotein 3-beta-glucuronosyltransferase I-like isoform X2 [Onthophagus taurus]|uniref:galactosylgalactosylxylosylprotein 3-beta-glucuronosyltransferase I-like isoform X2 n=1 Tax=Onthophagus taurus TaxID=166361 RepID=UPI000C20EAA3|nr:galactosylgalactosylxylosylprotein 3-beta-glucuronosyltransferase I-like isoform X2 [Onthophagus taurus]